MIRVDCENCKQTVKVNMYFSSEKIISNITHRGMDDELYYSAVVNGKAICPACGIEINKTFCKYIHTEDIIRLALGGQEDGL